jgi:hypothetical protein
MAERLADLVSTSDNKYVIDQYYLGRFKDSVGRVVTNFVLNSTQVQFLASLGVPSNTYGTIEHAHPVAATIDNYLLHLCGQIINGDLTVYSSKAHKVAKFFKESTKVLNPAFEGKDLQRYDKVDSGYLLCDTSNVFFHDTLHYMSLLDAYRFVHENPDVQRLYATVIVPPEILENRPCVPNPAYSFEYHGEFFTYFPDSKASGCYRQPLSSRSWLEVDCISGPQGNLNLARIDSFGAHHLMLLSRADFPAHETRGFECSNAFVLPAPTLVSPLRTRTVPVALIQKISTALLCCGSYTMPQVYTRVKAILRECGLDQDAELLVLSTNFSFVATLPYRNYSNVLSNDSHWLTRLLLALLPAWFVPLWSHPLLFFAGLFYRPDLPTSRRILINTRTHYLSSRDEHTVFYSAIHKLLSLGEMCASLASALLDPPRAEYRGPAHIPLLLSSWILANLGHPWAIVESILSVGLPVVSVRTVMAYSPILLVVIGYFSLVAQAYARFVWFTLLCNTYSVYLDLTSWHPRLRNARDNLDSIFCSYTPSYSNYFVRELGKGELHSNPVSGSKGELRLKRLPHINHESSFRGTFPTAVQGWLSTYDPTSDYFYCVAPGRPYRARNEAEYPDVLGLTSDLRGQRIIVLPDADDQPSLEVLRHCLTHEPHSVTTFTGIRTFLSAVVEEARCLGFETTISAEYFPGLSASVQFVSKLAPKFRSLGSLITRQPRGPDRQETSSFKTRPILPSDQRGEATPATPSNDLNPVHTGTEVHAVETVGPVFDGDHYSDCFGRAPGLLHQRRDNDCVLASLSHALALPYSSVLSAVLQAFPDYSHYESADLPLPKSHLITLAQALDTRILLLPSGALINPSGKLFCQLRHTDDHVSPVESLEHCPTISLPIRKTAAQAYVRSVMHDHNGVFLTKPSNSSLLASIRANIDSSNTRGVEAILRLGQCGSGKSHSFKEVFLANLLAGRPRNILIIYASSDVRDHDKQDFERRHPSLADYGSLMLTPEKAFASPSHADFLMLDEVGRYLPGQSEALILHLKPRRLYITGDPLQGRHAHIGATTSLANIPNWLDIIKEKATEYLDFSYRCPANYSDFFAVPCFGAECPVPNIINHAPSNGLIISPDEFSASCLRAACHNTMTYGTCQGLDTDERYTLLINHNSALQTENQVWSAMTRGKRGFDLLVISSESRPIRPRPGSILEALIARDFFKLRLAVLAHRRSALPPALRDPLRASPSYGRKGKKAPLPSPFLPTEPVLLRPIDECPSTNLVRLRTLQEFSPDYNHLPDPSNDQFTPEETLPVPELTESFLASHSLAASLCSQPEDLANLLFPDAPSADSREIIYKGTQTSQVPDDNLAQSIYLRHRATDPTLGPMGIKKRIRWRTRDAMLELMEAAVGSQALINMLKHRTGMESIPWNEERYSARVTRSLSNLLEKDKCLNHSKSFKCDPSLPDEYAYLLIKQQVIKKFGKEYSGVKAPQILTEHAHTVALDLAPFFMYALYEISAVLEEKDLCYLHPGHSDSDLKGFVRNHWDHDRLSTEDDAEAWDSNFSAPLVAFEFFLFDYLNAPVDLKTRFQNYKINMSCGGGPIAFMMFSGGPDTLPANTLANAILQPLRLSFPRKVPRLHGGDDFCLNGVYPETEWWAQHSKLIPQVFKTQHTLRPMAFGWVLDVEPHKHPLTIVSRIIHSLATNKISDTLAGLVADGNDLLHPESQANMSDLEVEYSMIAAGLLNHLRKKHRLASSGWTTGKTGSRRKYETDNLGCIAF